ncbi:MAG: helicase C-terminal domain-containing protein [Candidatus Helarchaeota archaeon]
MYLCRTHTQSSRVIEELKNISTHLKRKKIFSEIGAIGLRGRNALCFHPLIKKSNSDASTSQLVCQQLRKFKKCDFFKNMRKKQSNVIDLINQISNFPMDGYDLIKICEIWELCPYFLSQKALNESELTLIACNYQWMINPHIREIYLEHLGTELEDIILVIDEAHNFPETAIDMASRELTMYSIDQMMKEADETNFINAVKFGEIISKILDDFKSKLGNQKEIAISAELIIKRIQKKLNLVYLEDFFEQMIDEGDIIRKKKIEENRYPRSFLYNVGSFWLYWIQNVGKDSFFYCISKYMSKNKYSAVKFEINCLDPTIITNSFLKRTHASIHLSGTLNTGAYLDILNLPETTKIINLPSPFSPDQFKVFVTESVTTRNTERTVEMYEKIVQKCIEVIENTPKNIGIFAASYQVMNGMMEQGIEKKIKNLGKKFFREKPEFSAKENDAMVKKFKDSSKKEGGVLLGVCGGRNAEGEDFPGDLMNAVIVVGIPFATPSLKINSIINYYSKLFNDKQKGKDLGYNIKAFQKASQAAGRSMRSLDDKSVVVLLDQRYYSPYFNRLLASWLREYMEVLPDVPELLGNKIRDFWNKNY